MRQAGTIETAAAVAALAALAAAMALVGGFTPFEGYDDARYVAAALRFFEEFPLAPANHWEQRHALVAPPAVAFAVLGFGPAGLTLWPLLATLALAVVTWSALARAASTRQAAFALAVLLATPLIARSMTLIMPENVELAAVVAAFWLVWGALRLPDDAPPRRRERRLAAAGVLCALACLTRETAIFAPVFLGLWIAWRTRLAPRALAAFVLGGLAVAALDLLYMWAATGDPLRRAAISLGHTRIHSNWMQGGTYDGSPLFYPAALAKLWRGGGVIDGPWWARPYLTLLMSTSGGLVPLAGAAAVGYLATAARGRGPSPWPVLAPLFGFGAAGFVTSTYVLTLAPETRYYLPLYYACAVAVGYALADLAGAGRWRLAAGCLAVLVATGALAKIVNAHDRPQGVALARRILAGEIRHESRAGDPQVASYLAAAGRADLMVPPGEAADVVYCRHARPTADGCPRVEDGWVEVWAAPSWKVRLGDAVGALDWIPGARAAARGLAGGREYPRLYGRGAAPPDG